jgi:CDP-glycerol glycerophosphotransferase (TagB/SpsB family)
MKEFVNKQVLIAPYTAMTIALKTTLENSGVKIIGFIDKNQKSNAVFDPKEVQSLDYDAILILSPNHFVSIYNDYSLLGIKEKVYKVELKNGDYQFLKEFDSLGHQFFYNPNDFNMKREKFVFISKGFISANNKFFYLYCYRNHIDCIILTDNEEQLWELQSSELPCALLETKETDYNIAIAKFIIFDQGNYTYLPSLHPEQKTIQLWHGVGLKKMAKNGHITYDYFISTSSWTNETNFKHIFSAKRFLQTGYPRNDILNKNYKEDELDLLFCDSSIYNFVKNNKNIALYMPTHRESQTKIPLDWVKLNEQLQKIDFYLVIKLHPHVLEHYQNIFNNEMSNILFHNANGDIYPILKYVDVLISDYSSIVYDFLLLNKPIVFFNYDIEEYNENMPFLFDYDEYSPGKQVKTQYDLVSSLAEQDSYLDKRTQIRDKFFDNTFGSSRRLMSKIAND